MNLFFFLMTTMAAANVRIYTIVLNNGTNGATVTYKNVGTDSVDVSEYWVESNEKYVPIGFGLVVAGTGPVIPPGGTWTIDYTAWATQGAEKFGPSSDLSLYENSQVRGWGFWDNLVDFVQWCYGGPYDNVVSNRCDDAYLASFARNKGLWSSGSNTHLVYTGNQRYLVNWGGAGEYGLNFWDQFRESDVPNFFTNSGTTSVWETTTSDGTTGAPTSSDTTGASTTSDTTTGAPTTTVPSDVTTDNYPCNDLALEIFDLQVRLGHLKNRLGC